MPAFQSPGSSELEVSPGLVPLAPLASRAAFWLDVLVAGLLAADFQILEVPRLSSDQASISADVLVEELFSYSPVSDWSFASSRIWTFHHDELAGC